MMNTKKIIGLSSAILIAGTVAVSTASAIASTGTGMVGGDKDSHGCIGSAGYSWSDTSKKCIRAWEQESGSGRAALNEQMRADRAQMNQDIKEGRKDMQQENAQNRQMMGTGGNLGTAELKNFLKTPLTTEEQTSLKTLLQANMKAHMDVIKDTTLTSTGRIAKLTELFTNHITALLPYIATDKQNAFKKIMEERIAIMIKNQTLHGTNKENRQEFRDDVKEQRQDFKNEAQAKRKALSEKLHKQLEAIVEKLSLEKLNKVITNIEKVVEKVKTSASTAEKKARVLAQLEEIRTVIQDKIDMLTGANPEGTILDEVLSGVTNDGTGTTSTGTTSITQ